MPGCLDFCGETGRPFLDTYVRELRNLGYDVAYVDPAPGQRAAAGTDPGVPGALSRWRTLTLEDFGLGQDRRRVHLFPALRGHLSYVDPRCVLLAADRCDGSGPHCWGPGPGRCCRCCRNQDKRLGRKPHIFHRVDRKGAEGGRECVWVRGAALSTVKKNQPALKLRYRDLRGSWAYRTLRVVDLERAQGLQDGLVSGLPSVSDTAKKGLVGNSCSPRPVRWIIQNLLAALEVKEETGTSPAYTVPAENKAVRFVKAERPEGVTVGQAEGMRARDVLTLARRLQVRLPRRAVLETDEDGKPTRFVNFQVQKNRDLLKTIRERVAHCIVNRTFLKPDTAGPGLHVMMPPAGYRVGHGSLTRAPRAGMWPTASPWQDICSQLGFDDYLSLDHLESLPDAELLKLLPRNERAAARQEQREAQVTRLLAAYARADDAARRA